MTAYAYIVHKLLWVLQWLPPETLPAAILATTQLSAVLAGLPWILDLAAGGSVSWYLKRMFEIHVWPELPPQHQRTLLMVRDCALLKRSDQDRPTTRSDESAFSRNSKRHPHW